MKPIIVAVGYNRPKSLLRLLRSIENAVYDNNDVTLMISLDKAENSREVLEVAESFQWTHGEKKVRTFEKRQGLRKHVISCGDLTEQYDAVIILEDDLMVSKGFYKYVCQALDYYGDYEEIAGISLYSHEWDGYAGRFFQPAADEFDTYLGQFGISWGQCWTKKQWAKFKKWYLEREDKLGPNPLIPDVINTWSSQSWGRYFNNYIVDEDMYYVIPRVSLSTNCSEIGQHAREGNNDHQVRLLNSVIGEYRFAPLEKAVRYDIFFENMELPRILGEQFEKEGVDIDLNNTGRNDASKRYILSTAILPYKSVLQYGIHLRPIDMNVIYGIEGEGIYLYDKTEERKPEKRDEDIVIRYEIRGMSNRRLLKHIFLTLKRKLLK